MLLKNYVFLHILEIYCNFIDSIKKKILHKIRSKTIFFFSKNIKKEKKKKNSLYVDTNTILREMLNLFFYRIILM